MRNLNQHAGAVTRLRVASARATVRQVEQNLQALRNNVVAFSAAEAGDKSNAARVMLLRRMVKSLRGRQAIRIETRRRGHLGPVGTAVFESLVLGRALQSGVTPKSLARNRHSYPS